MPVARWAPSFSKLGQSEQTSEVAATDEAQLLWRFVRQPSLCPVSSRIWPGRRPHRLRTGWLCQVLPPTLWALENRRLISGGFESFILALALPGDGHCEELQPKHIDVSAGLLHASAGKYFLLELLETAVILAYSNSVCFYITGVHFVSELILSPLRPCVHSFY